MIIHRVTTLLRRRKTAADLKVNFERSATFRLPDSICLNGRMQGLSLPDENGVRVAFIDLLLDDCYGCRDLQKNGAKIETVLDIGGNVGLFGLAARSAFPNATIHSYEPNQQLESHLAVQAKAAEFDYFIEAVGIEEGMISLDFNEDSVQTRSKYDERGDVHQTSFRKAIEHLGGKVDLLKMDCEGAEWHIFEDKESWKRVKHLSMEYHLFEGGEYSESKVKETIQGLGFTITYFNPCVGFGLLRAERDA